MFSVGLNADKQRINKANNYLQTYLSVCSFTYRKTMAPDD